MYYKIQPYSMKPERVVPFNIYRKDNNRYSLVVEKKDFFPKNLLSLIQSSSKNIDDIYISSADKSQYYSYLESILGEITKDSKVPLKDKSKLIYDTSSRIINNLFENPESKESIVRSKVLVKSTIDVILSNDRSIKSIMEIGSHDYYTYTHSVDVSVFAIGFANYLKFSHNDISNIGYGAMMHDIGKSRVPSEIITNKGKLTKEEFSIMKTHPLHGYDILQFHGETNEEILKAVRNHHEKARGNGYPDMLTASKTHLFAKIVSISDIFSALTTKRPYKEAYSSFEALSIMKKHMIDDLDKKLFIEFIQFMSKESR